MEDNPLYNGSGIYNFTVSAYKYNGEEIDLNNLGGNVKEYFKELNPKKVSDNTYRVSKMMGKTHIIFILKIVVRQLFIWNI